MSASTRIVRVGIVGASGYTGVELMRLCAQHPNFDLVYATGDTQAGTLASSLYPSIGGAYPNLVFETFDDGRIDELAIGQREEVEPVMDDVEVVGMLEHGGDV